MTKISSLFPNDSKSKKRICFFTCHPESFSKTRKELAAAYGVSVRTIYRWLKELGIPADRRLLTRECLQKLYAKHGNPYR